MKKAGFVNIVGKPNAGKSTLMNILVGERMSVITPKPQTTRKRVIGIVNGEDYQIVFSDTPGVIDKPSYKMQQAMNQYIDTAFEDSDILLWLVAPEDDYSENAPFVQRIANLTCVKILLLNKIDMLSAAAVSTLVEKWQSVMPFTAVLPISALHGHNTEQLLPLLVAHLPEGEPFYPEDQLTDRSERFFVSEIIREKILLLYQQEIPYACEVIVETFKETTTQRGEPIVNIAATIYVARKTQKPILLGTGGAMIKKLGTEARKGIEAFLQQKVFLELFVKVKENWRDDERQLRYFGYQE